MASTRSETGAGSEVSCVGVSLNAGDQLAGRYVLADLLTETGTGRFWRARDMVLDRDVAVHLIARTDPRAAGLLEAARAAAPLDDARMLRVLDADEWGECCFVVNEWGSGRSLDHLLAAEGPMPPRRAAWVVAEVADSLATAHEHGMAHGRLMPENVLIDHHGQVRLIGFAVEAALHGLPPGRMKVDQTDLVALLYACLTGKWAGVSPSGLPAAPSWHGTVLRPRRVRAGIPRLLDALCEETLNPMAPTRTASHHGHDVTTPSGVASLLDEFVGDAGDLVQPSPQVPLVPALPPWPSLPVRAHPAGAEQVASPSAPLAGVELSDDPEVAETPAEPATDELAGDEPVARNDDATPEEASAEPVDPEPDDATSGEPVAAVTPAEVTPAEVTPAEPIPADPIPAEVTPTEPTDVPTEAGLPVFAEGSDEVDWVRTRSEPPPPPPALEAVERPLFAPDPPEGEPVRRARPGARVPQPDFWPWESTGPDPAAPDVHLAGWLTATGSGTWSGSGPLTGTHDRVPGRSWFRLAVGVAVTAVILVVAVLAWHVGNRSGDGSTPGAGGTAPTAPQGDPTPFTGVTARDFDPQGAEPRTEYRELVPLAIDGNPASVWHTETYKQNFGPGGLKDGVGLVVNLNAAELVRQVSVLVTGGPTTVQVFVTDSAPTGVAGLTPVGTAQGDGSLDVTLEEPVGGRYVTIWLTSLPQVDGGYRGTVAEVEVLG